MKLAPFFLLLTLIAAGCSSESKNPESSQPIEYYVLHVRCEDSLSYWDYTLPGQRTRETHGDTTFVVGRTDTLAEMCVLMRNPDLRHPVFTAWIEPNGSMVYIEASTVSVNVCGNR